jgi:hypothetical protein
LWLAWRMFWYSTAYVQFLTVWCIIYHFLRRGTSVLKLMWTAKNNDHSEARSSTQIKCIGVFPVLYRTVRHSLACVSSENYEEAPSSLLLRLQIPADASDRRIVAQFLPHVAIIISTNFVHSSSRARCCHDNRYVAINVESKWGARQCVTHWRRCWTRTPHLHSLRPAHSPSASRSPSLVFSRITWRRDVLT